MDNFIDVVQGKKMSSLRFVTINRSRVFQFLQIHKNDFLAILLVLICTIFFAFTFKAAYLNLPSEHYNWLLYSEEHFNIGQGLYETGRLENDGYINTERPPGYPVYVAGVLLARDALVQLTTLPGGDTIFGQVFTKMLGDNRTAVAFSHFIVAQLSALVFYLIVKKFLPNLPSLILLLCYQLNITFFSLILRVDYSLIETLLILLMFLQLLMLFSNDRFVTIRTILLGGFIGLCVLFRPVYLLFPAFFFLYVLLVKKNWVVSIKYSVIVLLALLVVLAPNIYRNYRVAGKFILTSEQGGVELYHNAVVSLFDHPEYTLYGKVWEEFGWPLMRDNLGFEEYSGELWYSHTAVISELFWKASIDRLSQQPFVYITNVIFNIQEIINLDFEYWGNRFVKRSEDWLLGYQAFHFYLDFIQIVGIGSLIGSLVINRKSSFWYTMLTMVGLLAISYSLVYFFPRYIYFKYVLYYLGIAAVISWVYSKWKTSAKFIVTYVFLGAFLIIGSVPVLFFAYIINQ